MGVSVKSLSADTDKTIYKNATTQALFKRGVPASGVRLDTELFQREY